MSPALMVFIAEGQPVARRRLTTGTRAAAMLTVQDTGYLRRPDWRTKRIPQTPDQRVGLWCYQLALVEEKSRRWSGERQSGVGSSRRSASDPSSAAVRPGLRSGRRRPPVTTFLRGPPRPAVRPPGAGRIPQVETGRQRVWNESPPSSQ